MESIIKLKVNKVYSPIKLPIQNGSGGSDTYTGDYEVTPDISEQILQTQGKTMIKNVTVHEIPYAEVSNESGTTVTICS